MALCLFTQSFDIKLVEAIGLRNFNIDFILVPFVLVYYLCMLQKVIKGRKEDFLSRFNEKFLSCDILKTLKAFFFERREGFPVVHGEMMLLDKVIVRSIQ